MADRVGQQFGNYQLTRLLGEGGFAEVYLGKHIYLGTYAAIKVLHTQLTSNDVHMFRTEAQTIGRLIHPHIVRVLEFGIEGKTPFLVMDYAPNSTLRHRHPRGIALPLPIIIVYVKQIADALQYAHKEKVIHRDIKPENMLIGRRNEILLSDFGIALVAQSSRYQSDQGIAGTMAYMAPEQIQGKPRAASDQYSLGIVVYEWLSGDRPFHGSLTELVGQHLSVPPPSLREKVPTISLEVDRVVLTALAKDPKGRFDCIQSFADALHKAAQLPPSMGTLSSIIKAPKVAPTIPPKPISQSRSDQKPRVLASPLSGAESAHLGRAIQTANFSLPSQRSKSTLHSLPQYPPRNAVPPFPYKRRSSKRFLGLVGGVLGLISLLVVLFLAFKLILSLLFPPQPQQKWAFQAGNESSSPIVVNGVLYIGSDDDNVYALDAETGHKIWTFQTGDYVQSSPAVVNGVVYIGSRDHNVYALDAKTGHEIWSFQTGDWVLSSPTVVNGVVYIGSRDHNVYALDANTGHKIWSFQTSNYVDAKPTVVNGVLYVGSDDDGYTPHEWIYALDVSTGQQKWAFQTNGAVISSPVLVNGVLYVGSFGSVYALDASTGQQKWTFQTGGGAVISSPVLVNGVLYIGTGGVYALDAKTGHEIWAFGANGVMDSSPTVVNGVLYIGADSNWVSSGSGVYAIDASTGQQKWVFSTDFGTDYSDDMDSSLTVVNGVLYVGSDNGKVYALTLPSG